MNDRPTKDFLCSYHHDGSEWSIIIQAYDMTDAEKRVKKLGFLRLDALFQGFPGQHGVMVEYVVPARHYPVSTLR